jgi:hypothetical protein
MINGNTFLLLPPWQTQQQQFYYDKTVMRLKKNYKVGELEAIFIHIAFESYIRKIHSNENL